jgi:hypothetical protein
MDPITLIIAALAAGGAAGVRESATSAVSDAYGALKSLVLRKLAGRRDGSLVVARYEEEPEVWKAPLAGELKAAGAEHDQELLEAAQLLMRLVQESGGQAGKYQVSVEGSSQFQIGDNAVQNNTTNVTNAPSPAPGPATYDPPRQYPQSEPR